MAAGGASASALLELGALLLGLGLLGVLAGRLSLPGIPLYLLAGLALGATPLFDSDPAAGFVEVGAVLGVVLLLLTLGLEFTSEEFSAAMRRHLPSGLIDLVANATPGFVVGWLLGFGFVGSLALAGVTWISSSGIVAQLLSDLGRLANRETPAVLSVLVLEDIAMAIYLPVLAVLASGGEWPRALLGVVLSVGVVAAALWLSARQGERVARAVSSKRDEHLLLRVLGLTLLVAGLAEFVDASAAVGAFLVGLALVGQEAQRARELLAPLRDVFAAIFFVSIGLNVELGDLPPVLPAALLLAVITAVTKVWSGSNAAAREGAALRGRLRAGTALIARGEFSLVIAGIAAGVNDELAPLATAYVLILAVIGPVASRLVPTRVRPVSAP
jgi:CPA2 family monovalent cation:H+ antiporter-2